MLTWSLSFLVLALIAGIFGFTGIAVASAGIAKILFFVFIALFIGSFFFRSAEKIDRRAETDI